MMRRHTCSILFLACLAILLIVSSTFTPIQAANISSQRSVVVIPVEFPDLHHRIAKETIDELVFLTLNEYFKDVSYGKLSLTGKTTNWFMMPHPYAFYIGGQAEARALLLDAIKSADDEVDFSKYQHIIIVHAGDNAMRTFTLGKNMQTFYSIGTIKLETNDGAVHVGVVGVSEMDPVGPYANAFLFNLGLINLFDSSVTYPNYKDNFVGEWDAMAHGFWANNGSTPTHPSSFSKIRLGWITSSQIKMLPRDSSATVTLTPLSSELLNGAYYTIKIPLKNGTYYLIEARAKEKWDQYIPEEGVVIYICDDSKGHGEGAVKVVSANPPSLDHGSTWKVGSEYYDKNEVVRVRVLEKINETYVVNVAIGSATVEYAFVVKAPYENILVKIDGKSYFTDKNGEVGLKVSPGKHSVSIATMVQVNETVRAVFSRWSNGESSNSTIVDVFGLTRIEAKYAHQYFLEIKTDYGEVDGEGWYSNGAGANVTISTPFDHGNGTRRVFVGWTGDYEGVSPVFSIKLDRPKTVIANWKKQFRLTIESAHGAPSGSGWYDENAVASVRVQDVMYDGDVRYVFMGWTGDYDGKDLKVELLMDSPKAIAAAWKTQHKVSIIVVNGKDGVAIGDVSFIEFRSPNGSTVILEPSSLWLDSGDWTLERLICHAVDVKTSAKTYATNPGATWKIAAHVYSLTVKVSSSLTGWPVQGATVAITLPDGILVNGVTDKEGKLIFTNLPPFMYEVKAKKDGDLTKPCTVFVNKDSEVQLKIMTMHDKLLVFIASLLAITGTSFSTAIWQKRKKAKHAR